jgi:hypothetical protein
MNDNKKKFVNFSDDQKINTYFSFHHHPHIAHTKEQKLNYLDWYVHVIYTRPYKYVQSERANDTFFLLDKTQINKFN